MFLGFPGPLPGPVVTSTDPTPAPAMDPSVIKQKL
jgi:hypothetical protein